MKASIIIPAYNAAGELERAVLSVVDSPPSFPYEILVIDDGSTDDTPRLLEALSRRFPALRSIRQKNAGPAAARNRGIREAEGEYLLFLDSDDVFVPGGVERAVSSMEKSGAELLIFGFSLIQRGEGGAYHYPETLLSSSQDFRLHLAPLYSANMLNQVWAKVFRREMLLREKIFFPDEMWGEDRLFFFSVLEKAGSVRVISDCLYEYIQKEGSLVSRFLPKKPEVCQRIHRCITSLAREKGALDSESEKLYAYMYLKSLLSCLMGLFSPSCHLRWKEKRSYVRAILSQEELSEIRELPREGGISFAVLARVLKSGGITANLISAWGMHVAAQLLPGLFRKEKHAYNKGE